MNERIHSVEFDYVRYITILTSRRCVMMSTHIGAFASKAYMAQSGQQTSREKISMTSCILLSTDKNSSVKLNKTHAYDQCSWSTEVRGEIMVKVCCQNQPNRRTILHGDHLSSRKTEGP